MENEQGAVHVDDSEKCIHYWLIGQRNLGVCRKCGASKQFCGTWSAASSHRAWKARANNVQPGLPDAKPALSP